MYYKARKVDNKPYLIFDKVAYSQKDAKNRGLINNGILLPGVVLEKNIPIEKFGISVMDLDDDGNLIPRKESDFERMKIIEEQEQIKMEIKAAKILLKDTDWVVAKCAEMGVLVKQYYLSIYTERQNARNRINELEKLLTL